MTPVVQNEQRRIKDFLTFNGHRGDVINSLVDTGISIQIGSELNSHGLTPWNDTQPTVFAWIIYRSVEGHML